MKNDRMIKIRKKRDEHGIHEIYQINLLAFICNHSTFKILIANITLTL